MAIAELGPLLTHFPMAYEFSILYARLRCRYVQFVVIVTGTLLSLFLHNCRLVDGATCLYNLDLSRSMDHDGAESMALSVAIFLVYFQFNYVRNMATLFIIVLMILIKINTDTSWYTIAVTAFLLGLSLPRMWRLREFRMGVVSSIIGLGFYYAEPDTGDDVDHSLWHLFGNFGLIFFTLAGLRFPCDGECTCIKRIPMAFWDAPLKDILCCKPWSNLVIVNNKVFTTTTNPDGTTKTSMLKQTRAFVSSLGSAKSHQAPVFSSEVV